jgi:putative FmdB family regulatory protein
MTKSKRRTINEILVLCETGKTKFNTGKYRKIDMPTYEYECKNCGYIFDVFQNMSDDPLKVCPKCGKDVRRLINGGTGVIFKGSGFYVTDKNKKSGAGEKSGKPAPKPPAPEVPAAPSPAKAESPAPSKTTDG